MINTCLHAGKLADNFAQNASSYSVIKCHFVAVEEQNHAWVVTKIFALKLFDLLLYFVFQRFNVCSLEFA